MKVTHLLNHHMAVVKGTRLASPEETQNGGPEQIDNWTLVLTDRNVADQIQITFELETRDELVRQLTGGVVLAGGVFPKI